MKDMSAKLEKRGPVQWNVQIFLTYRPMQISKISHLLGPMRCFRKLLSCDNYFLVGFAGRLFNLVNAPYQIQFIML